MDVKNIKPNLLNPIVRQRLVNAIKPPVEDYWKPVKNRCSSLYENYILPNIYLVIFIIFVIVVLIYRYKITQDNRQNQHHIPEPKYFPQQNNQYMGDSEIALLMYNYNKEMSKEPVKNKGFAYPIYPHNGDKGKLATSEKNK